jgi:5-methylcytosine-specific restriction endonuclease McrA
MKPPTAAPNPASKFARQRPFAHLYASARWRKDLRPAILRRDPICVECHRYASDTVDHVKDHRGNLALFYDPKNLRGVCARCHNIKTGSQHGIGDRTANAADLPYLIDGLVKDYGAK